MKLSGWLLRLSLILMVAISLVFTWLIWQNPSRLGSQESTVAVTTTTDPNVAKQRATVFTPTRAYYQGTKGKYQLLDADKMMAHEFQQAMTTWRLGKVSKSATLSSANYTAQLTMTDSLQLYYPAPISYKTFNQTFFKHSATKSNPDFKFNRLVFTLGAETVKVHFINDTDRTMRVGTLANVNLTKVRKLIASGTQQGYPVTEMRLGNREIADYSRAIRVQPYLYLLDQQSANHYVAQLMPTQETSAVDTREIGSETVYTAGSDYRLTETVNTGVMAFENATAGTSTTSLTSMLRESYTALGSLGLTGLSYMRYTGYDSAAQTVTFRSYAQGLPIFNNDYYGRVAVSLTGSGLQMTFSGNNLTVPIPTKQARVTLPATADLFGQLNAAGYGKNEIQDIVLGYDWEKQGESSQLVTLIPTYYVKINNEYQNYKYWLNPQSSTKSVSGAETK